MDFMVISDENLSLHLFVHLWQFYIYIQSIIFTFTVRFLLGLSQDMQYI